MTVIDVGEADFQRDVIDRSAEVPVVVDFWAEWCGPCRTLTPLLEREAAAREGKIVLAKVDTDANQQLAAAFQIQGIPAVKAFRDGRVVSEFTGVQPPAAVTSFFDSLVPSEADELAQGEDEASLRRALELDPGHPSAGVKLASLLHRRGDSEAAAELLADIAGSFAADGLAARIRLEQDPVDGVGDAFAALDDGQIERGVDLLIELLGSAGDRRDDVRMAIVGVLDELGVEHPFARDARRRLATALY